METQITTSDGRLVLVARFCDMRSAWRWAQTWTNPMHVLRNPRGDFDVCEPRHVPRLLADGWTCHVEGL